MNFVGLMIGVYSDDTNVFSSADFMITELYDAKGSLSYSEEGYYNRIKWKNSFEFDVADAVSSRQKFLHQVKTAEYMGIDTILVKSPCAAFLNCLSESNLKVFAECHSREDFKSLTTALNENEKLFINFHMTADLPDFDISGEPIELITLDSNAFITNAKGFLVLPKRHQKFISIFLSRQTNIALKGISPGNMLHVRDYLLHLSNQLPKSESHPYRDVLQIPLEPLADDLCSGTYTVFEQDSHKYNAYHDALLAAFQDRTKDDAIIVAVLGIGRGPLVDRVLNAADSIGQAVKVYAIEKNSSAIDVTISKKMKLWGSRVTLVQTDMREWKPREKVDIIVSELLGSFSDNELSPECLNATQHILKNDGIYIPSSYSSLLTPIKSIKLFRSTKNCQVPYVVNLDQVSELCELRKVFTFEHPNSDLTCERFVDIDLHTTEQVHGFAGYFECTLYKSIKIHTKESNSWFPMFFPIQSPVSGHIKLQFWRKCDQRKVWYEWIVNGKNHNLGGLYHSIRL